MKSAYHLLVVCVLLAAACSKSTSPPDVNAPRTPTNFRILGAGDGQIFLRWDSNQEPDLRGYRLYRSESLSGPFPPLIDLSATEFIDQHLSYDSTYYYRVTAVDFAGNESEPTEYVDASPRNLSPPKRPTGTEVFARNLALEASLENEVRWTPNEESDVDHYRIFRGDRQDFEADAETFWDSTGLNFYRDRRVQVGDRHFYRVVAVDVGGLVSEAGAPGSDTILEQAALLTPTGGARVSAPFDLQWQPVAGAAAMRIFVDATPLSDPVWQSSLLPGNASRMTYNGPQLVPGRTYYWWVAAYSRTSGTAGEEPGINSQSPAARFSTR